MSPSDASLTGLRGAHVALIARYAARFAMRTGGGLMMMLIVLTTGLGVAGGVSAPLEGLMQEAHGLGHSEGEAASTVDRVARSQEVSKVAATVTGATTAQVEYLLRTQPALLSAMFVILLGLFPFMTCFGAFNQTAGDIGSRGLRYLLLRTERPNVFFGRFLGTLGFLFVSVVIVMVLVATYVGIRFDIYPAFDLISWTVQGTLALMLCALPYAALCAWISAAMDSAFASLAICLLVTGFPIIFVKLLRMAAASPAWLREAERVLPWGWKYDLLAGDVGARLLSYAVMLGFTSLFLWLGFRVFQRRDV